VNIAVTGASGFLGRHVLRAVTSRGEHAITAVSRRPLQAEALPSGCRNVVLDLAAAAPGDYERLGRPDMLVHLAWGGLPNYLSLHHFEQELPVQYGFLRAMVQGGLPAMLVTGTCYEYGMVDGELAEDREPLPANPYAYAKTALWRQLEFLKAKFPFKLAWARLFYLWGQGQAPTSIYPLLQAAAARGDTSFPMSKGEQLRDYLPVTDAASMIAELSMQAQDCGIVNVSSGEPVSIRALVERWIAEEDLAITPELGRYPYPDYEPLAFWGSASKRRRILGDTAPVTSSTASP
jgi:dTDP-6-deoxy-L-talose 4-dehydrogenase (NAD+)